MELTSILHWRCAASHSSAEQKSQLHYSERNKLEFEIDLKTFYFPPREWWIKKQTYKSWMHILCTTNYLYPIEKSSALQFSKVINFVPKKNLKWKCTQRDCCTYHLSFFEFSTAAASSGRMRWQAADKLRAAPFVVVGFHYFLPLQFSITLWMSWKWKMLIVMTVESRRLSSLYHATSVLADSIQHLLCCSVDDCIIMRGWNLSF